MERKKTQRMRITLSQGQPLTGDFRQGLWQEDNGEWRDAPNLTRAKLGEYGHAPLRCPRQI